MSQHQRRLVAIVSMDVVGFTRLIQGNERHTLRAILAGFRDRLLPSVAKYGGTVFKTMGDGMLAEFASPVSAVQWAATFQQELAAEPIGDAAGNPITTRVGIVLADVIITDNDRFGEGINLAVRIEALSPPGGMAISRGVYEYLGGKTDLAFASTGRHELKNVAEPMEVWVWPATAAEPRAAEALKASYAPGRPSIVVLPFNNLSSDPEQDYFADGMAEELTATLSRIRDFLVIARNTAFTYKGRAVDIRRVAEELGVRYVLEGSVRKAGERIRVTAQLIEAETDAHLWSDRFEGKVSDIFDLQDLIAQKVAGAVYPSIRSAEVERASRKRPDSLQAYDLVMRALPHLWAHRMHENPVAIELLEKALRIDPHYGLAAGLAAWAHGQQVVYNWTADFAAERAKGLPLIEAAVSSVGDDPTALTAIASAMVLLEGNVRRGIEFIDRALALDPNHAWAWTRRGFADVYTGQAERAFAAFEMAMRLSPRDPFAFHCYLGMGLANFATEHYQEAIGWVRRALDSRPGMTWPYRDLAVFLAHAGELAEAKKSLAAFTYLRPPMTIAVLADGLKFMGPQLLPRYLEGLRLAGLEE